MHSWSSYANANAYGNSDAYCDTNGNTERYRDSHCDTEPDSNAFAYSG